MNNEQLKKNIQADIKKIEKAKKEEKTLFAQTIYFSTLGLVFVLPAVLGAYLGVWLDNKLSGFSISWTISLIIVGIFVGALNVYFLVKE